MYSANRGWCPRAWVACCQKSGQCPLGRRCREMPQRLRGRVPVPAVHDHLWRRAPLLQEAVQVRLEIGGPGFVGIDFDTALRTGGSEMDKGVVFLQVPTRRPPIVA
jgi:hypothetical protein